MESSVPDRENLEEENEEYPGDQELSEEEINGVRPGVGFPATLFRSVKVWRL